MIDKFHVLRTYAEIFDCPNRFRIVQNDVPELFDSSNRTTISVKLVLYMAQD
jgi:hypothetical protein